MTAPTTTKKNGGGDKAPAVRLRPFVTATRRVDKSTYDYSTIMLAGQQAMPQHELDANGFLSGVYVLVETSLASSTGAGTVVAYQPDAPLNALADIQLLDVNSKPIIGATISGYDLYLINKWGGYAFQGDAKSIPDTFTAITGSGTAAGNFAWCLRLPVELVQRNALGSVINKNNVATYKINTILAGSGDVYTVAPSVLPTVRLRYQQFGWMDPNAADMKGNPAAQNPPGVNSLQYWQKQTYAVNAGALSQRLIGIDSLVRNFVFRLDAATGARLTGENDFPDPFTLLYETALPIQRIRRVWRHMMVENFGYVNAVETAGGRDNGVYVEPYNMDFFLKPGSELTNQYLPVSSATALQVSGSIGGAGAHTLTLLVNKVVPANGNPLALVGNP
jgi:hypothetical protein